MATKQTTAVTSMYLSVRPGLTIDGEPHADIYDGLVSELIIGDWLPGPRQLVVAVGATSNGLRNMTLRRANMPDVVVNWVAASAIRFAR